MPDPADQALVSCLTPSADRLPPLVYPPDELFLKKEATVRVRLRFDAPDDAPKVEFLFGGGQPAFVAEVKKRVNTYRLPCWPAARDRPLLITQEFNFDPRDGRPVISNPPLVDGSMALANSCSQEGVEKITYPRQRMLEGTAMSSSQRMPEGVVLAKIDLTSADIAPEIRILYDAGSKQLAEEVIEGVRKARVRCDLYPATVLQVVQFQIADNTRYGLKDISLRGFVGAVTNLEARKIKFDFATMSCPFDVNVTMYQPHYANSVGEVGNSDPNRADFLEWLRGLSLRLPAESAKHLVGATTRISVPCGVLDLRD